VLTALVAPLCLAQFDTAAVVGTVKDQAGGVVAQSKVTLQNAGTGVVKSAVTDTNGNYTFFDVRPGQYRLKAESAGFKAAIAEQFTVTVNARQRVDLQLQVGQVTEMVEVSGAASAVETDSSSRGQVIAGEAIEQLPLNGRSYADLALLVPGVRKSLLEDGTSSSRDASYNVNGQRSALNNFMVDGVDNNAYNTSNQGFSNQTVQLTPDSVAEFKVETNNFSAEYGRAAGAVINATTKGGTNGIHGAVWEYMRNTSLNAVGFFKPTGGVKPTLVQNQFGAAGGGPIKKDKLFYFFDYEGTRKVSRTLNYSTLPTANQRAGIFAAPVQNPLTGTVYSNGVVPASDQTAFAKAVLAELPAVNLAGNSNNYQSLPRTTTNDDKGNARIDFYASSRLTTYFRYSEREANLVVPGAIPGRAGGNGNGYVHQFNQQVNPGLTWMLNPTTTVEARLGVTWFDGGKSPWGLGEASLLDEGGITGLPTDVRVKGALNSQSVNGFTSFGRQTSNPQFQNPFVVNPKLNLSKIWNRHTLKFGFEYQRIDTAVDDFNPVYGSDGYSGLYSRLTGASTSNSVTNQSYSLADFMFGARSSYTLNNFVIVDYRQRMYFGYVQDDFKVSQKLTLNLGTRLEFATPQWEKNNHLANFDPSTGTLISASGGSLYNRALVNPSKGDWAPRIGAAYQIAPRTSVRAAYGISFIHFNRMGGENLLAYNGPYIVNASISQDPSNLAVCASKTSDFNTCFRPTQMGYPENFASPSNFNSLKATARYIPKDNPTGYIQSWHFTVQRELVKNLVLDVGYVGNKGTHIMILGDINQARVNNAGENVSLQNRRPYSKFADVEVAYGAGYSHYDALQVKLEKRFSSGLLFMNSFTWSKSLDSAPGHLETGAGSASRANLFNLRSEKSISDYDQPINDTLSGVYQLPFGNKRKWGSGWGRVADSILGGWQMTLINSMTSGLPVNITYSPGSAYQVSGVGLSYRPNYVSGSLVTPERTRTTATYLSKTGLSAPTDVSHPFGNLGRNAARSYGMVQTDMGMHKEFPLWKESAKLSFRAEIFNLTNRTNFKTPASNISSSDYGSITTTYPARQVQFAARVRF
jgi:hypothetical protein